MPCYNAESSVAGAVTSIQTQTFSNWELIVVDDGSSDTSASIVEAIGKTDPRVRLIRRDHKGVVDASNHGFSLTKSPIIARMDADDVSHPERLEKQYLTLQSNSDLGAVTCLARFAGDRENAAGYAHHVEWTNRHQTSREIELNRFVDLPFPHPTLMYRRELVENLGGYRQGDFPEDFEMVLRWINSGVSIGKVKQMLYDWHDPPSRLSRNDPRYHPMAFHRCKAHYLTDAIIAAGCGDRDLWLWGAGRPARKCAHPLEQTWKQASGFIDVDPRKIGRLIRNKPVVSPQQLPAAESSVIVSYVGTRGARDHIRNELIQAGRVEGLDFWLAC